MSDFVNFRTEARAAFSDLHISVMMSDEASARGLDIIYYHLTATGMPIGASPLTVRATSPAEAIRQLIGKVGPARRAVKAAAEAARQARRNRTTPLPPQSFPLAA